MQNIATKIFIYASVAFGIIGITFILFGGPDGNPSQLHEVLVKLLIISIFTILPSFALSVAGKYLSSK